MGSIHFSQHFSVNNVFSGNYCPFVWWWHLFDCFARCPIIMIWPQWWNCICRRVVTCRSSPNTTRKTIQPWSQDAWKKIGGLGLESCGGWLNCVDSSWLGLCNLHVFVMSSRVFPADCRCLMFNLCRRNILWNCKYFVNTFLEGVSSAK